MECSNFLSILHHYLTEFQLILIKNDLFDETSEKPEFSTSVHKQFDESMKEAQIDEMERA